LKPENVFLTSDGRVKILDFGLARLETVTPGERMSATPTDTQTGAVMGTAGYMSPEQVRGKRADARSDIFALGCILYEMVTGRRAFNGETTAEVLVAILKEDPEDPAIHSRDLSEEARLIILRSLAKEPEARFESARDLAFALKVAGGPSSAGHPARPFKPRRRWALFLAAAAVLAAAAAALWPSFNAGSIDSLAVLPFVNASGDAGADYLSDGLAEGLIQSLSRLQTVRVQAWTTVFQYKGKEPLRAARDLRVRAVLTGRVLLRGGALVAETELVDVRRGTRLWGDKVPWKIPDASPRRRSPGKSREPFRPGCPGRTRTASRGTRRTRKPTTCT
jgi:TolB-like protein